MADQGEECRIAVRMAMEAAGQPDAFSNEQIDGMVREMRARSRGMANADPNLRPEEAVARAANAYAKDRLNDSLDSQLWRVQSEIAFSAMSKRLDDMAATGGAGMASESVRLRAALTGVERQAMGGSRSTNARQRAAQTDAWATIARELGAREGVENRMRNPWGWADKGFCRDVMVEMARLAGDGRFEPTNNEDALFAARILYAAREKAREDQNRVGARITKREGYVLRNSHDRMRVGGDFWKDWRAIKERLRAGEGLGGGGLDFETIWKQAQMRAARTAFSAWRNFTEPLLHPRTFEGVNDRTFDWNPGDATAASPEDKKAFERWGQADALYRSGVVAPDDLKGRFLLHCWWNIVTGGAERMTGAKDGAEFLPPGSRAEQVSRARVLEFKDPVDAWQTYNLQYGTGGFYQTILNQIGRGAQNAVLMEDLGPAPADTYGRQVARLKEQATARFAPDELKELDKAQTRQHFELVNGTLNVPEDARLAQITQGILAWQSMAKMGGIVLSKPTDMALAGNTMARVAGRGGYLMGIEAALIRGLAGLDSESAKLAAETLGVGAEHTIAKLSTGIPFNGDGSRGWMSWGVRMEYLANLFSFVNDRVQKGVGAALARYFGMESDKAWDGLHIGTQQTLERWGWGAHDWEFIRQGIEPAADGKKYFTSDHFDQWTPEQLHDWNGTPDELRTDAGAEALRSRLALDWKAMMREMIGASVGETQGREQVQMMLGQKAGTPLGSAMRLMGQFKGFALSIGNRHVFPASQGFAGISPVWAMSHLILMATAAGFLSMNAKRIVRGEKPTGLWGASGQETLEIWLASLAQGGGLGLYGDYILGEHNRNGGQFALGQLLGPTVGDFEQAATIVQQAIHGTLVSPTTGRNQFWGEALNIGKRNIPWINTFYTRLALDYGIMWELQEKASPGYLQRYEDRVRKDGGDWWVPPSSRVQW